jgi:hypothetical protein
LASAVSGKTFIVKKTSDTLTTVAIVSNAATMTALHTRNETINLTSNGTTYNTSGRVIPKYVNSYTPTITGLSGYTYSPNGFWWREGIHAYITFGFTKDGSTGSSGTIVTVSLPTGMTMSGGGIPIGGGSSYVVGGIGSYLLENASGFGTLLSPLYTSATALAIAKPATGSAYVGTEFAPNSGISGWAIVQISGWNT